MSPDNPNPTTADIIAKVLSDVMRDTTYTCGRVWEAWQYGTMSVDDFSPAWENDELIGSMVDELVKAGLAVVSSPPEPTITEEQIFDWFGSHSSSAIRGVLDRGQEFIDGRLADGVFE